MKLELPGNDMPTFLSPGFQENTLNCSGTMECTPMPSPVTDYSGQISRCSPQTGSFRASICSADALEPDSPTGIVTSWPWSTKQPEKNKRTPNDCLRDVWDIAEEKGPGAAGAAQSLCHTSSASPEEVQRRRERTHLSFERQFHTVEQRRSVSLLVSDLAVSSSSSEDNDDDMMDVSPLVKMSLEFKFFSGLI